MKEDKKSILIPAFLSSAVFFIIFHGSAFTSRIYAHDYLMEIYKGDAAWQIALGRICQPVLEYLRGAISSPWIIGSLMLLWTALSVCITVTLLDIKKISVICFISAFMSGNIIFISANASYMPWSDYYAFSLFLSLLSLWFVRKNKIYAYVISVIMLAAVFGIYQAYVFVYICMAMILFILDIFKDKDIKKSLRTIFISAVCFIIAGLIYLAAWKLIQKATGIWTSNTYNGLDSLGDYEGYSLGSLIINELKQYAAFFICPPVFVNISFHGIETNDIWKALIAFVNILIHAWIIISVVKKLISERIKAFEKAAVLIILILLPFAINGVSFLSKGMVHTLMMYPCIFVYVFALRFIDENIKEKKYSRLFLLMFLPVIWNSFIVAGQAYYKRNMQEEAAQSLVTRIICRIEETEGYEPGITKTAFAGSFEDSPYIPEPEIFKDLEIYGIGKTSITYRGLEKEYIKYIMNVDMNLTDIDVNDERVKAMPYFPKEGSVGYIDDTLVVKIADIPQ